MDNIAIIGFLYDNNVRYTMTRNLLAGKEQCKPQRGGGVNMGINACIDRGNGNHGYDGSARRSHRYLCHD